VAEKPEDLVFMVGREKRAELECFHAIVRSLKALERTKRCWCNRGSQWRCFGRMSMRAGAAVQFESGGTLE